MTTTSTNQAPRAVERMTDVSLADAALASLAENPDVNVSAEAQVQLVASYQRGRYIEHQIQTGAITGVAARRAQREVSLGRRHGEALVISIQRLVGSLVSTFSKQRLGARWANEVRDDMYSEGMLAALEACASYDPTKGAAVSTWVQRLVTQHLVSLDLDQGGGTRPREWRRAARIAHAIRSEMTRNQSAPSNDELSAAVWERCIADTIERMGPSERALDVEEQRRRAEERLCRQSMKRAVQRELSDIMATSGGALSLDLPNAEGDGTLADVVADRSDDTAPPDDEQVVQAVLAGLPALELSVINSRFGLGTNDKLMPYDQLAALYDLDKAETKTIVRRGMARVTAPHAQFCRLAAELPSFFEEAPTRRVDVLSRHRERIAQG